MEFETLSKYRIPAIMIVYNNDAWGVWQSGRGNAAHMYLFQQNLRYDKIAEALGARGEHVTKAEDFLPALSPELHCRLASRPSCAAASRA